VLHQLRHVRVDMRGKLHLEDWISAKLKLPEINDGFANMKAGNDPPAPRNTPMMYPALGLPGARQ
jgi:hypothetical protein